MTGENFEQNHDFCNRDISIKYAPRIPANIAIKRILLLPRERLATSQIGAFLEQLHLYCYRIARRGSEKVNRNSDPPKAYYSNLELWHNMSYGCCECRVGTYRGQLGPKVGFRPPKYR